jgi:hypothetical protein
MHKRAHARKGTCSRCLMTSAGFIAASLTTVAAAPAAATASGWCPERLPPSASLATSYTPKYTAWAGLVGGWAPDGFGGETQLGR